MADMSLHTEMISASDRVLEAISTSIISGEMAPGTKLTEADLAKRFGLSRAPLREALLRLEERQLIERVPFSGTRVASLSPNMMAELYEIREVLEGLACRRAAKVITPVQIAALRTVLKEGAARVKDIGDSRRLPAIYDFHKGIAEISGNRQLTMLLSSAVWQFSRVNYRRWARTPERLARGAREHERIVDALEAHDPELAEMLMRRHIAAARQGIAGA